MQKQQGARKEKRKQKGKRSDERIQNGATKQLENRQYIFDLLKSPVKASVYYLNKPFTLGVVVFTRSPRRDLWRNGSGEDNAHQLWTLTTASTCAFRGRRALGGCQGPPRQPRDPWSGGGQAVGREISFKRNLRIMDAGGRKAELAMRLNDDPNSLRIMSEQTQTYRRRDLFCRRWRRAFRRRGCVS